MAGEGVSFRSFVSETELDEKRRQRQEEWEKVRTAEQPLDCPEDEVDPRSLFEKLQQQKDKKQSDFDEQFKFKNMVRGIDEDESKFLDEVADRQMEMETKRHREEKDMLEEMKEYTERVVLVDESKVKPTNKTQPSEKMTSTSTKTLSVSSTKRSQASLLAGAVKRKRSESGDKNGEKKSKPSISTLDSPTSTSRNGSDSPHDISNESKSIGSTHTTISETTERTLVDDKDRAQVVSILPGLGFYSNSSDSDTSSSDSEVDLLNSVIRRPTKKKGNASCN